MASRHTNRTRSRSLRSGTGPRVEGNDRTAHSGFQRRQRLSSSIWVWLLIVALTITAAAALRWFDDSDPGVPDEFSADAEAATMVRVVDGDTIVVELKGAEERVRLLNIDTPETVHPYQDVECGGPEASQRLNELLEPGETVILEFDQERRDRYDRLLAGVFTDETFINEQMAREGWAEPVLFEPNDRFLAQVEAAWSEAEASQSGLFSSQLGCATD